MRKLLVFTILIYSSYFVCAQDIARQNYGHLSLEDGLSQGYITAIIQDKTGFLWFGTNDGLNRYDGYDFRKYYNKLNDLNSLSSNQITWISVDKIGRIWVGTNNGLNLYNADNDDFTRCKVISGNNSNLSINCIQVDKENNIWISFVDDPFIHCYNPDTRKTESFRIPQDNFSQLKQNEDIKQELVSVWYFSIGSDNKLYIGATNGTLMIFDKTKGKFRSVQLSVKNTIVTSIVEMESGMFIVAFADGSLCYYNSVTGIADKPYILNPNQIKFTNSSVYRMVKDENDNIYIGTQGEGLFFFDVKRKIFDQVLFVEPSDRNIISKGIYSMFFDKSGILWCGTNGYGVYNLSPKSTAFKTINQGFRYLKEKFISNDAEIYAAYKTNEVYKSLNFQSVRGIYANKDFIFAGGYIGLDRIDRKTGSISSITKDVVPYVICPDAKEPEKYLWIGTESKLFTLFRYNILSDKMELQPLNSDYIFALYPDKDNILWLGTKTGLYKYNTLSKEHIYYSNVSEDLKSIQPGAVRAVKRDKNGVLWIGTETGGISYLDEQNGKFTRYQSQPGNYNSLSCNTILFLDFDNKNNMLIGTGGGGINIFDSERKSFFQLTTQNGLPNNVVYSILEDNSGTFWISTNKGICNLNPKDLTIKCYYSSDGLQGNEYNTGSYFRDSDGILFFGGVDGLTYFNPSEIKTNEYKPEVVVTYIKKNNEEIKFNRPIYEIEKIEFDHDNNVFTIGFSALSFYQSNKNQYAYRLTGHDDNWILLGAKHEISFNSLEEGTYTLEILATNNDGVWNKKPLILTIRINPPFYETWWFILLCLFLTSGLVIGFVFYRISQAKNINKILSSQVEERTSEIIQQKLEIENQKTDLEEINSELRKVNTEKDKFFSIIAHDLKSPFNAILGFSRLLNEEFHILSDENKRTFAGNIKEASEATYRLLENLLEWSRVQANKIEIKPEVIDLGNIAAETFSLLHSSAEAKNINLSSSIVFNTTAYADENMVKTVFRNLVSNAIKFTKKGGEIKLSATDSNDYVEVSVSDNGVGISEENIKALFRLDVSLKSRGTANESGTGLGLIICKEFTERNGGTITVKSMIGIGSTFLFTLPKSEK